MKREQRSAEEILATMRARDRARLRRWREENPEKEKERYQRRERAWQTLRGDHRDEYLLIAKTLRASGIPSNQSYRQARWELCRRYRDEWTDLLRTA